MTNPVSAPQKRIVFGRSVSIAKIYKIGVRFHLLSNGDTHMHVR